MYATPNKEESYYQKAYDFNGYGGMLYYSSATCGFNEFGGKITSDVQQFMMYRM